MRLTHGEKVSLGICLGSAILASLLPWSSLSWGLSLLAATTAGAAAFSISSKGAVDWSAEEAYPRPREGRSARVASLAGLIGRARSGDRAARRALERRLAELAAEAIARVRRVSLADAEPEAEEFARRALEGGGDLLDRLEEALRRLEGWLV